MDSETWKIVVEGAKLRNHVILCNGTPEKPFGFSLYAKRTDPMIVHQLHHVNKVCFRCDKQVSSVYYEWIHPQELKSGQPLSLGEYKPICVVCFFK